MPGWAMIGASANQDFLRHAPSDDQLTTFEPQNKGSSRAVALDFHLDTGNESQSSKMGAHGAPAVHGNETNFPAGAGHCEGYVV